MVKLLENHFLVKEDSHKNIVGTVTRQIDPDWNNDSSLMLDKDNKHKPHQKGEERAPPANLDEYAAIDVHNINLIYLRRGLMENLLEDSEKFHLKVVGSIVRIRISGSDQNQDMYRLVQVVGTSKVDQPYKLGNGTTDVVLEVLNLNKKETVSADSVSNEEFSEVQGEASHDTRSYICSLCKKSGHNKRGCSLRKEQDVIEVEVEGSHRRRTKNCSLCNKSGHNKRGCPLSKEQDGIEVEVEGSHGTRTKKCSLCKKSGHNKRGCHLVKQIVPVIPECEFLINDCDTLLKDLSHALNEAEANTLLAANEVLNETVVEGEAQGSPLQRPRVRRSARLEWNQWIKPKKIDTSVIDLTKE